MAHIQDRGKDVERRWQARYRDPAGRERSKAFRRKLDARRWLDARVADLVTGRYVDPRAGRITLGEFAEGWLAQQTFAATSRQTIRAIVGVHILPHLGDLQLREIRPSAVQGWVKGRQEVCSPRYVGQQLTTLSSILTAAVADQLIPSNPCDAPTVKPPKVPQRRIVPWSPERVDALVAAHPPRYRAIPVVAAGCGLRQGEVFGLRVEDVDFLRRRLLVRRQVRLVRGRRVFALPKGGREREVPLPDWVALALSEALRHQSARTVALPWADRHGQEVAEELVFTTGTGNALDRNEFNRRVWKPALRQVGVEPSRRTGMHALRHHYASVALHAGVSIRALADYLGHHDPGYTLRVYAHLMPESADRARQAIDGAHGTPAESVRNEEGA